MVATSKVSYRTSPNGWKPWSKSSTARLHSSAGALAAWLLGAPLAVADAGAVPGLMGPGEAQYQRGAHFVREGDLPAARLQLDEAVLEAPDSPKILRLYAEVLVLSGEAGRAQEILRGNHVLLEEMAAFVLEHEVLDGEQMKIFLSRSKQAASLEDRPTAEWIATPIEETG